MIETSGSHSNVETARARCAGAALTALPYAGPASTSGIHSNAGTARAGCVGAAVTALPYAGPAGGLRI